MFLKTDIDQLTKVIILLQRIRVKYLLLYFITSLHIFNREKYFNIAKYIFLNNVIVFYILF